VQDIIDENRNNRLALSLSSETPKKLIAKYTELADEVYKKLKILSDEEFKIKKLLDLKIFNKFHISLDGDYYTGSYMNAAECTLDLKKNLPDEFEALRQV